jgi:hypothetical protein
MSTSTMSLVRSIPPTPPSARPSPNSSTELRNSAPSPTRSSWARRAPSTVRHLVSPSLLELCLIENCAGADAAYEARLARAASPDLGAQALLLMRCPGMCSRLCSVIRRLFEQGKAHSGQSRTDCSSAQVDRFGLHGLSTHRLSALVLVAHKTARPGHCEHAAYGCPALVCLGHRLPLRWPARSHRPSSSMLDPGPHCALHPCLRCRQRPRLWRSPPRPKFLHFCPRPGSDYDGLQCLRPPSCSRS